MSRQTHRSLVGGVIRYLTHCVLPILTPPFILRGNCLSILEDLAFGARRTLTQTRKKSPSLQSNLVYSWSHSIQTGHIQYKHCFTDGYSKLYRNLQFIFILKYFDLPQRPHRATRRSVVLAAKLEPLNDVTRDEPSQQPRAGNLEHGSFAHQPRGHSLEQPSRFFLFNLFLQLFSFFFSRFLLFSYVRFPACAQTLCTSFFISCLVIYALRGNSLRLASEVRWRRDPISNIILSSFFPSRCITLRTTLNCCTSGTGFFVADPCCP